MRRYRFENHAAAAPGLHFCTAEIRAGRGYGLHDHDYHELFWVMAGQGWHVRPHGREPLTTGDAAFIAPRTVHGFAADPGSACVLLNVVIATPVARRLRRWLAAEGLAWPWLAAPAPTRLDETALRRLSRLLADAPIPGSALDRDRLLFGILAELLRERRVRPVVSAPEPDWLRQAVALLREQPAGGVHHLVRACGRSREHVARSVRRCYATTPSTLANHLRCDLAARRLRLTTAPIIDIAQEVGFADLAHFYRCFTARHGCPPRAYRRTHRSPVV